MTQCERKEFESLNHTFFNLFWMPGTWFVSTLKKANSAGLLKDEKGTKCVMEVPISIETTQKSL